MTPCRSEVTWIPVIIVHLSNMVESGSRSINHINVGDHGIRVGRRGKFVRGMSNVELHDAVFSYDSKCLGAKALWTTANGHSCTSHITLLNSPLRRSIFAPYFHVSKFEMTRRMISRSHDNWNSQRRRSM
jgi:hypothetical protein